MTLRIGINGFGRIGRLVTRAIFESKRSDIVLAAINDPGMNNAHLLKYDSVHGRPNFDVECNNSEWIKIAGQDVHCFRTRNPKELYWARERVDIVLECSGKFTDRTGAQAHLDTGAKKVLISAPATDEDITIVYGINENDLKAEHAIVSNGSCTTNCLVPVAYVLHKAVGIERGFMTTIHSYTGDQNTVDASHRDPYRARAAAMNIIPTSTGAAKAVAKVLPELKGKLDGVSVRVPTPNVSLVDFKFVAKRPTTVEEVNNALTAQANRGLKGILGVCDEPLVSSDFIHDPHSAIISRPDTKVVDGTLVRVMAWYDNEWAFSLRMLDVAAKMHQVGY